MGYWNQEQINILLRTVKKQGCTEQGQMAMSHFTQVWRQSNDFYLYL